MWRTQRRGLRAAQAALGMCLLLGFVASCGKRDSATVPPATPSAITPSQTATRDSTVHEVVGATVPKREPAQVASERPPIIIFPDLPGDSDAIVIFPNGQQAATCGQDGRVTIYDVAELKVLAEVQGAPGRPRLAASGDGKLLAQSGESETGIRVWSIETGEEINRLDGHEHPLSDVAFSRDGSRLASASSSADGIQGEIRIWDLTGTSEPQTLDVDGGVASIALSPDGLQLASCGHSSTDGVVSATTLWNLTTRNRSNMWENRFGTTTQVAFAPSGRTLAIAERNGPHRIHLSNRIRLVDLDTGKTSAVLLGHLGEIGTLAFSPNGDFLLSTGVDSFLLLWQVSTATLRASTYLDSYVGDKCTWADAGDWFSLAARKDTESIRPMLWNLGYLASQTDSLFAPRSRPANRAMNEHRIRALTYSNDGNRLAFGTQAAGTFLLDASTLEPIRISENVSSVPHAFSPDLSASIVAKESLEVHELGGQGRVRDLGDDTQQHDIWGNRHTSLFAALVSPDRRRFATTHVDFSRVDVSFEGLIKIRNWPRLELHAVTAFPEGVPYACDFARDGSRLVVAGGAYAGVLAGTEGPISIFDLSIVEPSEQWKLRSLKRPVKWTMSPAVQAAFEQATLELQTTGSLGRAGDSLWQVVAELPQIKLSTDPKDIHWHLVNPNPTSFGAVRFDIPDGEPVDLICHVALPYGAVGCDILLLNRTNTLKPQYLASSLLPLHRDLAFQHISQVLTSDDFQPGAEGIIWWAAKNNDQAPIQVGVNAVPAGVLDEGWAWPVSEQSLKDAPLLRRRRLFFHGEPVAAVSISPDGKRLASVGAEGDVKVWDAHSGEVLTSLASTHARYSPDGRYLATVDQDGGSTSVSLWDAETHEHVRKLSNGHFRAIRELAFSPDGLRLATGVTMA